MDEWGDWEGIRFTTRILPFVIGRLVEIAAVQRIPEDEIRFLVRLYTNQAVKLGARRYNNGALYKYAR